MSRETQIILQDDEIYTLIQNAINACKFAHTAFRDSAEGHDSDEYGDEEADPLQSFGDDNTDEICQLIVTDLIEHIVDELKATGDVKASEYVCQLLVDRELPDRWDDESLVHDYLKSIRQLGDYISYWFTSLTDLPTMLFVIESLTDFSIPSSNGDFTSLTFIMTTDK